ncbi:MAG: PhzF family phenazine biosynthesis isomerase [Bacteroidetes bacterium]|nr:PhzF family phenazine biosynthesis isomerase [Bacteroidota bacterium]
MNKIPFYQVDAFTDTVFSGNPAAVCIFIDKPDDDLMLKIAAENNLSETAFVFLNNGNIEIRWFSPTVEIALCGHGSIAAAHIIMNHYSQWLENRDEVKFQTRTRGEVSVRKFGDAYQLNFPLDTIQKVENNEILNRGIGTEPTETWKGSTDYLLIYEGEEVIRKINPAHHELKKLDVRGIIVSAPGNNSHFVSRFFAPGSGIDEDPVTGSAHTLLTPYWSDKLNLQHLKAEQLSERGGKLECSLSGDRVLITGKAITVITGVFQYE